MTVPLFTTVEELVEDFIYRHQFKLFPVVAEGNRLAGIISLKDMMKFFKLKVDLES